ncbi:hypothetical protein J6590_079029 [Homalodisca vitripennis]|nr:hypothetical protein J6590_079029 [Homalodisca vitripennis]
MDWEWSEWTVGSRTDPPRTFTGRDGSDNDDTRVEARRDTNGPGLDSDAGQLRTQCVDIVCWFETGQSADRIIYGDTFRACWVERGSAVLKFRRQGADLSREAVFLPLIL